MALPAIPQSFYAQQGNNVAYLQWAITTGALSYSVKRSQDGVTFTVVGTPTAPNYTDDTVVIGTMYYYQVAAVNASGTSSYTAAQSIVPTPNGEMSLTELRQAAQQRADRLNSDFVTLPEWNSNINQSLMELYDLLVTAYEDYFIAPALSFNTVGNQALYPLPNGTNYDAAPAFYKLSGVDLGLNTNNNAYITVKKFNFIDRNQFIYPNTNSTQYGVFNLRYRIMGNNIEFIPVPSANQIIRLWYIPRLDKLLADSDITTTGISGWLEYVITDAAIKALQKEESDVSVLMAQKQALIKRIEESAMNQDAGQADTISDTRSNSWGGMGSGNFPGGW